MKIRASLALCALAVLCGCQTDNPNDYAQIGYGPRWKDPLVRGCETQARYQFAVAKHTFLSRLRLRFASAASMRARHDPAAFRHRSYRGCCASCAERVAFHALPLYQRR